MLYVVATATFQNSGDSWLSTSVWKMAAAKEMCKWSKFCGGVLELGKNVAVKPNPHFHFGWKLDEEVDKVIFAKRIARVLYRKKYVKMHSKALQVKEVSDLQQLCNVWNGYCQKENLSVVIGDSIDLLFRQESLKPAKKIAVREAIFESLKNERDSEYEANHKARFHLGKWAVEDNWSYEIKCCHNSSWLTTRDYFRENDCNILKECRCPIIENELKEDV